MIPATEISVHTMETWAKFALECIETCMQNSETLCLGNIFMERLKDKYPSIHAQVIGTDLDLSSVNHKSDKWKNTFSGFADFFIEQFSKQEQNTILGVSND